MLPALRYLIQEPLWEARSFRPKQDTAFLFVVDCDDRLFE
jgi:hypothetical protein